MDNSLTLRGTCRYCKAPLIKEVTELPVYRCMAECDCCLYRTILRDDPIELPIRESLQPYLTDDRIEDMLNGFKNPQDACMRAIDALLNKAIEMIEQNRTVAIAGLLYLMDNLETSMGQVFTDPQYEEMPSSGSNLSVMNLACQILYLLLARGGKVELPRENIQQALVSRIVAQQIYPLLTDIVVFAKTVRSALFEQSIDFQIKNGKLLARKLLKHDLMVETTINMLLQEKRESSNDIHQKPSSILDVLMPEHARRAISLATGIDLETLVQILNDRMSIILEQDIGERQGDLLMVADQSLVDEGKKMFQTLSLTYEKIYQFRTPSFFDTGSLRDKKDTTLMPIVESAAINWSAYYPCGSPVLMVISKIYLNKQANSFSRKESNVLKP